MPARRRRLLFIVMTMELGGAERSLVNLLNLIDYTRFEVDLLIIKRSGVLLEQIPSQVNVIRVPELDVLYGIRSTSPTSCFSNTRTCLARVVGTLVSRVMRSHFDPMRLHRWKNWYEEVVPRLEGEYDTAVAYSGGETLYYMVDKVEARNRVTYFHSDYSQIPLDVVGENAYLDRVDGIVTISNRCLASLESLFPTQVRKMSVIQNPSSPQLLHRLALDSQDLSWPPPGEGFRIVSIGRLHPVKGFDLAVEAASLLVSRGLGPFKWVIVGEGAERGALERMVSERGIGDVFELVGLRTNPYPYLCSSDLLVQPSRFEGKSMVLDEAKVFGKPVVVTSYPSAEDQVLNEVTGLVVAPTAVGIADGIERVFRNPELLHRLSRQAQQAQDPKLGDITQFTLLVGG